MTLDARLAARDDLRFTPAGLAALDFQLAHESMQTEANGERRVACELAAGALGPIAKNLSSVAGGARVRWRGVLAGPHPTGASRGAHRKQIAPLGGKLKD